MEHPLKHPVELKDKDGNVVQRIDSLELRRFKGADVAAIGNANAKGAGEALRVMVCRMAGIPPSTFDQLDGQDVTELGEVAAGFLGGALPTGAQ